MLKRSLLFLLCFSALIYAQDTTKINVFENNYIQFGNTFNQDPVVVFDNGRQLKSTVQIPEFDRPVRIMAHLDLIGNGDWIDRAGNVMLHFDDGTDIELIKFVTTYGCNSSFDVDLTELAVHLQGTVSIIGFVDTWVAPAWKINFTLRIWEDQSAENANWADGVYYNTGLSREQVTDNAPKVKVNIPSGMKKVKLTYYTSGHCTDGIGADEFVSKDNVIYVDGAEVYRYEPWRDDCADFTPENTSKCRGNYHYSRSGWCPGSLVYPVELDLSAKLTPGEHEIRFAVENIRGRNSQGNLGYWRVSSYTTQYLEGNNPVASKIKLIGPEGAFIPTNSIFPLRIDLQDAEDHLVINGAGNIEVSAADTNIQFSSDKSTWSNPIVVDMKVGSKMIWMKGKSQKDFVITANDINGALTSAENLTLTVLKNYAREATATADGQCAPHESAAQAIDGDLGTKWCNNSGQEPYHHITKFAKTEKVNYFRVFHAGAGGENTAMNTADYDIEVSTAPNEWVKVAEVRDNFEDANGNITEHVLSEPVDADSIRLTIIDPGVDMATRIYEFEIYNYANAVGVENDIENTLISYDVKNNYPNPFNGNTIVKFIVPERADVSVNIYNVLGELVKGVFAGTVNKGEHSVSWDATNAVGQKVAGGVYFYSIRFNNEYGKDFMVTKKMIYLP